MIRSHSRHTQKLHHIQENPNRHKRPNRYIPTIPKLQPFRSLARLHIKQALTSPTRQTFYAGAEQPSDEKVHERCDEEGEEEEVDEDEDEGYAEGAGDAVGVGDAPG
jgi:hypothetical protein